ncbi:MAG: glycosyltransferase, partial [Bacteroidota bacterium]
LHPPVSGVIKRNHHLFLQAARRHEVSVITLGDQDEDAFRRCFGRLFKESVRIPARRPGWRAKLRSLLLLVTGRSEARHLHMRRMQKAIDRFLRDQRFDLIHLSTPFLFYYRFPKGTTVVCDTHNVEYDNVQRMYREARGVVRRIFFFLVYHTIRRDEIHNLRKSDVIMATSERDATLFRQQLPEKRFVVVPNGVDVDRFMPDPGGIVPHSVVFTGLMEYYPNEHGVLYFMEKVFPLIQREVPDTRVYIVGAKPSPRVTRWASPQVEVTGYVEDVRPYLARAQVAVIPLWIGGGTRLKALEAVAMKKPIVSTSVGCEGITFTNGADVLIADTPESFAAAVVRLFSDAALRNALAEAAYRDLLPRYRWETVGGRLDEAYRLATAHGSAELL